MMSLMNSHGRQLPYQHVSSASGPMLLINSLDEFVPITGVARLSQRLTQVKVPVETISLTGRRAFIRWWFVPIPDNNEGALSFTSG